MDGNNRTNKNRKRLLAVIITAASLSLILAGCSCGGSGSTSLPKEKESITASGKVTAPEVPTKDSKKETESKKDAASGKDAKTDDKTDNKQDSNTTGNNTSNANTQQGQTNNKPSGNNTTGGNTTGSGSQGGNTSGGNTTGGGNTPASHTHSWQAVYKTVTHPAVTQEVWVEDSAAWDEPQYAIHEVCYTCGLDFDAAGFSNADAVAHAKAHKMVGESDQSGGLQVQVGTIHHDAVGHYETKTVTAAWSEQVLDHYECSCGATK